MRRREFSVSVRKSAFNRADGICECGCERAFGNHPKSRPHYDHIVPDNLGGAPTLENCMVMRVDCHQAKSRQDMRQIAKARRGERARKGLTGPKRKIPGRRFNGEPIWPN